MPNRKLVIPAIAVLAVLSALGWLANAKIRLAAERVARDELRQLGALVTMDANGKHVQGLNLSLPAVKENLDRAMALLPKLTYLEVLTLSETPVTDQQMAPVASCSYLTSLKLTKTALGDVTMARLARLQKLRTLYLAHTNITAQGLKPIGSLGSLTILDLSGTALEGNLEGLAPLSNLQHLLLNDIELSEAAAETIGQLPNLGRLTVHGSKFSDQVEQKLKQAKPEMNIDRD